MRSLRLAMIAHGIPAAETAALAELLGIESLEDIEELLFGTFMCVPLAFRSRVLALRNRYKRDDDTDWLVPDGVNCNWLAYDVVFWAGAVQYATEHGV